MEKELLPSSHRPDPLPSSPWLITQTWEHILFMHWELPASSLQALIPSELELDMFDGSAWLSILPFRVVHQRIRGLPEIPLFRTYLELNVRTYVKHNGYNGVYFFLLDANHPLAVLGAKALSLPYRYATMEMQQSLDKVNYKSKRIFESGQQGEFTASYKPTSPASATTPGSLDHWLLERYCLFTKWGNQILRGDIHHQKWEVSQAEAEVAINTAAPFSIPNKKPLLHYAPLKKAFIGSLKKMG
ncbi:YqjF family protein [Neobacillus sp. SM06]|uniref:YqjF family protein n=1 Tax=Neobacillus sp. SM06 TaxID=3422492 RepID=UPI003D2E6301